MTTFIDMTLPCHLEWTSAGKFPCCLYISAFSPARLRTDPYHICAAHLGAYIAPSANTFDLMPST